MRVIRRIIEKDLNWIFRTNHKENDFGIDAYFDVVMELGQVTGKTIAAQIKTGKSYFKESNDFGWVYRGKMNHLNYYLNHDIPVVLIIVDDQKEKAYWCECDPHKTDQTGKNWKITIPFDNELKASSKEALKKFLTPVEDYVSQLEHFWRMNQKLKESKRIAFMVDRPEIINKSIDNLASGFERLTANSELLSHAKESVDIWIHGYNEDPRELRDIPEFKEWLDLALEQITGWSYFLAKDRTAAFLRVIQLCKMNFEIIDDDLDEFNRHKIEFDPKDGVPLLEFLYKDLNIFCDRFKIGRDINYEISGNIVEYLIGERPPELQ